MNTTLAKKIFTRVSGEELMKKYRPELFGKRTPRCKKITYMGKDIWSDICTLDMSHIRDFTRDYSIEKGKYAEIHRDPEYYKALINKTNLDKKYSPCHPEQFSESVVKPHIRKFISKKLNPDDIDKYIIEQMKEQLENHVKERINQQSKADWSEYLILMNCPNIIPTLKNTKGTDMYLLKDDGSIEDLDIKTTRNIWGIEDKKEAIKKLYEGQGPDRFSSDPRLYIYLSDMMVCDSESIVKQLNEKYDIEFNYKSHNREYKVTGCRLIIV